jgi:hypothetical protein
MLGVVPQRQDLYAVVEGDGSIGEEGSMHTEEGSTHGLNLAEPLPDNTSISVLFEAISVVGDSENESTEPASRQTSPLTLVLQVTSERYMLESAIKFFRGEYVGRTCWASRPIVMEGMI